MACKTLKGRGKGRGREEGKIFQSLQKNSNNLASLREPTWSARGNLSNFQQRLVEPTDSHAAITLPLGMTDNFNFLVKTDGISFNVSCFNVLRLTFKTTPSQLRCATPPTEGNSFIHSSNHASIQPFFTSASTFTLILNSQFITQHS